jgi:hypothetical protein
MYARTRRHGRSPDHLNDDNKIEKSAEKIKQEFVPSARSAK